VSGPGAAPWRGSPLAAAELEPAAQLLARAFRDNPLNRAVIGSDDPERRRRANVHGLRPVLPAAHAHGWLRGVHEAGVLRGVLLAAPPGGFPLPGVGLGPRLRCLFGQGLRVTRRWAVVFERLVSLHPAEPHWYLSSLGVEPAAQGRGIGLALLADWLAEVDRDAQSAYLETDRPENVAFYERRGFATRGETRLFSTTVWCMSRPAARPHESH
jgi:ribosomal protein S18 acetylase RimI-like enzyme